MQEESGAERGNGDEVVNVSHEQGVYKSGTPQKRRSVLHWDGAESLRKVLFGDV